LRCAGQDSHHEPLNGKLFLMSVGLVHGACLRGSCMCSLSHGGCIRNPCTCIISHGGCIVHVELVMVAASGTLVYVALVTVPASGSAVYAALVTSPASEYVVYVALSSAVHAYFQRHTQQHLSHRAYSMLNATTGVHILSRPGLYTPDPRRRHMLKDQKNN